MKIFHIEDNITFIAAAEKMFIANGHDYKNVRSGQEALDILKDQKFDVVICDGSLLGSITGMDVVKQLRVDNNKINIIACSNGYNKDIIEAGANTFADKDFKISAYDFVWRPVFEELGLI